MSMLNNPPKQANLVHVYTAICSTSKLSIQIPDWQKQNEVVNSDTGLETTKHDIVNTDAGLATTKKRNRQSRCRIGEHPLTHTHTHTHTNICHLKYYMCYISYYIS